MQLAGPEVLDADTISLHESTLAKDMRRVAIYWEGGGEHRQIVPACQLDSLTQSLLARYNQLETGDYLENQPPRIAKLTVQEMGPVDPRLYSSYFDREPIHWGWGNETVVWEAGGEILRQLRIA